MTSASRFKRRDGVALSPRQQDSSADSQERHPDPDTSPTAGIQTVPITDGAIFFQDELIRSYRAFLAGRRALRPTAEYREPTDAEWEESQQHFQLRKVEPGTCGRPYATPCNHEHACIRCPMLRVDPAQRARLIDIIDNLQARQTEAHDKGWLGELQGLQVSLDAATDKLASLDRSRQTHLGLPTLMHTE